MSLLTTIGDLFYKWDGQQKPAPTHTTSAHPQPSGEAQPIQAVVYNTTSDQYRSFTELGRQVANMLDYQINLYTAEILDSKGKVVAPNIEMFSKAAVDLQWVTNNSNTASPFINWAEVNAHNEEAATVAIKKQISSYGDTY